MPGVVVVRKFQEGWTWGTVNSFRSGYVRSNCEVEWVGEEGPRNMLLKKTEYLNSRGSNDSAVGSWFFFE